MRTVEFEVCSNAEWIFQQFEFDENGSMTEQEAANACVATETNKFEAICRKADLQAVFTAPGGQRVLYHGWNGAQFNYRNGIFGTFDKLTARQIKILNTY